MEYVYKESSNGYRTPTGEQVTRCENCRYYASETVKYRDGNGDEIGSYCRQWRGATNRNGWCYKGKMKV